MMDLQYGYVIKEVGHFQPLPVFPLPSCHQASSSAGLLLLPWCLPHHRLDSGWAETSGTVSRGEPPSKFYSQEFVTARKIDHLYNMKICFFNIVSLSEAGCHHSPGWPQIHLGAKDTVALLIAHLPFHNAGETSTLSLWGLRVEPRAACMLGRCSVNWTTIAHS